MNGRLVQTSVSSHRDGEFEIHEWPNGNVSVRIPDGEIKYLIVTIRKINRLSDGYQLLINDIHREPPTKTFTKRNALRWAKEYLWSAKIERRGVSS